MSKHITNNDLPRTKWQENIGIRKVLLRAFNTSRKNPKRLEAMATWLRFLTIKVQEAQIELETQATAPVQQPMVLTTPPVPEQQTSVLLIPPQLPLGGELVNPQLQQVQQPKVVPVQLINV